MYNHDFNHRPQELADIVACNRNPATNMVEALDAWNIQGYGNNIDAVQDVQQFSGSYSSGRIKCRYTHKINYEYILYTMLDTVLLRG